MRRAVEAEEGGLLKLLEPLQRRAAERQLRRDLKTLKDVLEARGRNERPYPRPYRSARLRIGP